MLETPLQTASEDPDSRFVPDLIEFLEDRRQEIMDSWAERVSLYGEGLPSLTRPIAGFFLHLLTVQTRGESESRLQEMRDHATEEAIRDGRMAADLSRAQIALKRTIIEALVHAFPGDHLRLSAACELVETFFDDQIIAVSEVYYRSRQRGLTGELRASEERYGTLVETMNEGVCILDRDGRISFFNKRLEEITGYSQEEVLGQPLSLLYDTEELARVRSELDRRKTGEHSVYEVEMATKGGSRVPVTISGVPLQDGAGNYAGSFAVITDIRERVKADLELRQRNQAIAGFLEVERKRTTQLTTVSEIARMVLSTLDPDRIMQLSAEAIQRSFAYHAVFLYTLEPGAEELQLRAQAGAYREFLPADYRQRIEDGIVGWVARSGEVLLANDVSREPRRILAFPEEEKTASELCAPIRIGDRTIGAIDVQSERPSAFDEQDVTSLQILGSLIANALENARLFQEMKFLKEFNERVIDTIPMPLLFVEKNLRIVSANRAYCERRGLEKADLVGRTVREIAPDSVLLQDEVLVAILGAIREDGTYKVENVLRTQEFMNKVFNVLVAGVDRGQEREAMIVFEDITEVVERAYQFSMLRQVIESMQGILDMDRLLFAILTCVTAGTALGFNRAILLLIDRERGTIQGRMGVGPGSGEEASRIWHELAERNPTLEEILENYDRLPDRDEMPMTRLARRISIPLDQPTHVVVRSIQERRSVRVVDAFGSPEVPPEFREIHGASEFVCVPLVAKERVVGAVIVDNLYSGTPISDESVQLLTTFASQAGLVVENAEIYAQLEDKFEELEEAYRQIRQAQDDLLRSERLAVIGEMSARMAHEIRNPLSTIGGFARSIARGTRPERAPDNARIIVEEVERLEKLLADTLSFTRSTPLEFKPTDVNALVEAVLGLLGESLREGRVTPERSLDPDLPGVLADPAQLKQVLLNLTQNAVQAMPEGGALRISTGRGNGIVEVTVQDTGVGIPPEELHQVFSPFFTTKTYGTGLGLAISRKIISDHGGDIGIESQPGRGTTVKVRLPIDRNDS